MLLCIDVGNSCAHFGLFRGTRIVRRAVCPTRRLKFPNWKADSIRYASVVPKVSASLERRGAVAVSPAIVNRAREPGRVGVDRLCHAAAAWARYRRACVVISMGTAITVDVVSRGEFLGGAIAPGISTMARALHEFTAQLPLVRPKRTVLKFGRNTQESIGVGIQWCAEGLIAQVRSIFGDAPIIGTGGDGRDYARLFDAFDPDLTLRGIAVSCR